MSEIAGIFLSVNSPNSIVCMANSPKFPANDPPNSPIVMLFGGQDTFDTIHTSEAFAGRHEHAVMNNIVLMSYLEP